MNRNNLFNILIEKKIPRRYEPGIHECVNIKYNIKNGKENGDDHLVSIFVFQSGNIIITGAKNSK